MKKLLLFIVALFALSTVHAELFFHESFDKTPGILCSEAFNAATSNSTDWYIYATGGTTDAQVVEGTLSYADYGTASAGGKLQILQKDKRVTRQFKPVTSGKVYCSAIINVDKLYTGDKNKWQGVFVLAFGNGSATGTPNFAQLYLRSVKEGDEYVGYQLAIAKNGEVGTASSPALIFSETLNVKQDYLVVIEYEFVNGEMNDIARLYINPTKETTSTTLISQQEVIIGGNNKGAGSKSDATSLNIVYTRPWSAQYTGYSPELMYVDEIKVATTWAELFGEEGGVTPPVEEPAEITVTPTSFGYLQGLVGQTYTKTFTVNGKNLKEDITLTSDNAEVTLDKYTISKDAATDVVVTMTIAPQTDGYGAYKITLTSGEATATVTQSYWNVNVSTATAIAELNTLVDAATGSENVYIKYTGEAVVTYKYNQGGDKLYLQDATAGVFINDSYWGNEIKQGDKVTNCMVYVDPTNVVGGMKYIGTQTGIEVLSHGNEVTPQVVTLADLKNNAANYLNKLVKVENVTLDQTSTTFKGTDAEGFPIPDKITQNSNEATLSIVDSNPLVGTTKPKKADIIGISMNKVGNAIRPRGLADVISKDPTTAIENIALDMLNGDYEIYTVSGMRVDALQPGVNIIRQGDKTYKVVR